MTPLKTLKAAVFAFEERRWKYCLIGGHAASLYRSSERVTKDVDFAFVGSPLENSRHQAEEIVGAIGLTPVIGFIAGTMGEPGKVCMVTSKPPAGALTGIIDVLLPVLPWVIDAVEHAQANRLDLGFAKVPVITPEDLIIAKIFAFTSAPTRFQDLDDIKEILAGVTNLDFEYVKNKLATLRLKFPAALRPIIPPQLKQYCER